MKPRLNFFFAATCLFFLNQLTLLGQERSFDDLFPGLDAQSRTHIFSPGGLLLTTETVTPGALRLVPSTASGIALAAEVIQKKPSFMVESLQVIPRSSQPMALLQIYNALGKIRNLKGRTYPSFTRKKEVPLFEESYRIAGEKKMTAISDSPVATSVPALETMYLCLKDVNFGNSYYRADITRQSQGLVYGLTNFRNLTYLIFTVIKKEEFIARLYFEPIAEGVLIYGVAGAEVSDFAASQVDMPSAIAKRLAVIISWVAEGIQEQ